MHGITETDNAVFHKEKAWHNLGIVVEDAPTPDEALKIAGMDWEVNQTDNVGGVAKDQPVFSEKWVLNVRSDNNEVLGCVSENYVPIQNATLAHFCEQLSKDTVVKVESAGSLFGGKRLWFLLKAETFDVGNNGNDPVVPYILVANGHDGTLAFSARPTSVRVVCNNTLSWAMNQKQNVFNLRHTGEIMSRVDDARDQLIKYMSGLGKFNEACQHLRRCHMNREQVQKFFLDMYTRCVEPVPVELKTEEDDRARCRAMDAVMQISRNFDHDLITSGNTYWNAFNASSQWLQNRNKSKNEDTLTFNKVMGAANDNTTKAFNLALEAVS